MDGTKINKLKIYKESIMLDYPLSVIKKICQTQRNICNNCPIGITICEEYFGAVCPADWVIDKENIDVK